MNTNFINNHFIKTTVAAVILSLSSTAFASSPEALQTTVVIEGLVSGTVGGSDIELDVTEGGLSVDDQGVITTRTPTIIDLFDGANGNALSAVTATLNSISVFAGTHVDTGATIIMSADGVALVEGVPSDPLGATTAEFVSTDFTVEGALGAAVNPGDYVNTVATLTFNVTF